MRRWMVCIWCVLLSVGLMAQTRTMADAEASAKRFLNTTSVRKNIAPSSELYVFQRAQRGGFVVMSADSRAKEVLCYSDQGDYEQAYQNPHFRWWLERYIQQVRMLRGEPVNNRSHRTAVTPIAPLLGNISWDQNAPYNNFCPIDQWTQERSLAGCVATATAQIMRYWSYPEHGSGTVEYVWYNCRDINCTQYKTFNATMMFDTVPFDWANMPEVYDNSATEAQKNAVATLMLMVGMASHMQYASNPVGSSAWTDDMGYGLQEYFDYTFDKCISEYADSLTYARDKGFAVAPIQMEYNVEQSAFEAAFDQSLEAGCPILMGGAGSAGGHEFVCDGRDQNGLYHINWGWSGTSNCYCTLNALTPDQGRRVFSNGVDALVGLRPKTSTRLQETTKVGQAQKMLLNGKIRIRHHNGWYDILGNPVK
ncbi:MAG: C10 family peptidase [Paludibacteraceae bacterium]|nr:C10 family peptidase [Paludibacteraceae bacterium]